MSLESDGGMILTGKNRRTRRKTCPSATLSTTNPTWIYPGANPGLRGERSTTNDLIHGTAHTWPLKEDERLKSLPIFMSVRCCRCMIVIVTGFFCKSNTVLYVASAIITLLILREEGWGGRDSPQYSFVNLHFGERTGRGVFPFRIAFI
jgi:hypothetical protein